jgi:hypothetical protein
MRFYSKLFLLAFLAASTVFFTRAFTGRALAEEQKPKAAPAAQAQEEEETPYDDVEFGVYEDATKEPDLEKRGTKLLEFINKYPKSALMKNIEFAYTSMLKECSATKKWELLQSHAEKWLKIHPNDVVTISFISEAALNLQKFDKCAECYEEIYKQQPTPTLAKEIFSMYQKANNLAKQLEWYDKLSKMPEYDADFMMRFTFVTKYRESKNNAKAVEYAKATLKSTDAVKDPNADMQQALKKIRLACNLIIGSQLMEGDKHQEAIPYFKKALQQEKTGDVYYLIAQCQENMKEVEESLVSYAKVDLLKCDNPEMPGKAKARLEQLYKALHNNTTIGIEKITKKAKEELAAEK